MAQYLPADLSKVHTYSIEERPTLVDVTGFAGSWSRDATLADFSASLPDVLKARDLKAIVAAVVYAVTNGKPVIVGAGGHVIKTGLSPLLVGLMKRRVITAIAMNGGASIHDCEIALTGRTSEDVGAGLETGQFGMVKETPEFMNSAISAAMITGIGMGRALGQDLVAKEAAFTHFSILANGAQLEIPITVHISIGGDTIHMHPSASGSALGETSFTDFRILVSVLQDIGDGGVYINIGSAVVLPEVFLKALNLARNISGNSISGFTTVNMDMIQHYRPMQNVLLRPTRATGRGYAISGHHEIMVPLLFHLVLSELDALGII